MKIQNNKKITTIAILAIAIASIISMQNVLGQSATTQGNPTSLSKITDQYLLSVTPSKLSDKDMAEYKGIIMNNNEVKSAIDGKPYQFGSVGFIGNIYHPEAVWYPEIHVTVETNSTLNKDIAIVFDPATKSVTNIQTTEYDPVRDRNTGGANHSWSVQRFTGNSGTPDGILANMTAQTFTWDSHNRNGIGNVLLLNGLMSGSTLANACVKGSTPSTYFAQIGFYWESSGQLIWTDTNSGTGTIGCQSNFITSPTYVAGKDYQFRIVGATSGWAYYAIRSDTGTTFTTRGPIVNSDQMSVSSSNDGTSVFFENKYLKTDPSWYGQFGGSPSAYHAQYKTTTFGSYSNWSSTNKADEACNGTAYTYPYNSNVQVMTGSLASGATAQWSTSRMQTYFWAC
jgi:hypothetical protein